MEASGVEKSGVYVSGVGSGVAGGSYEAVEPPPPNPLSCASGAAASVGHCSVAALAGVSSAAARAVAITAASVNVLSVLAGDEALSLAAKHEAQSFSLGLQNLLHCLQRPGVFMSSLLVRLG